MLNKSTGEIEYEMKLRGIHFDVLAEQLLPYEVEKKKVMKYGQESPTILLQRLFRPNLREGTVITGDGLKIVDVICQKGLVNDIPGSEDFLDTVPFGIWGPGAPAYTTTPPNSQALKVYV